METLIAFTVFKASKARDEGAVLFGGITHRVLDRSVVTPSDEK
jgi:hypothetical protein